MTGIGSLLDPERMMLPLREAPTAPLTTGEVFDRAFADQRNRLNVTSSSHIMNPLHEERSAIFETVTGQKIDDLWNVVGRPTSREDAQKKVDDFILKGRETDREKFTEIPTTAELEQTARMRVEKTRNAASDVVYDSAFSNLVGNFGGSMAGYISDPVQAASMFVGAGELKVSVSLGKALLRAAAGEAAIGSVITTAEQIPVMEWNNRLGMDYGLDEAAANILMGGAFGAVAPVAAYGVKTGAKKIWDGVRTRPSDIIGQIAENETLPPSVRETAAYVERAASIEEANPLPADMPNRNQIHFENVAKAEADLIANKPIDVPDPFDPRTWGTERIEIPPARGFEAGELTGSKYTAYTPLTPREMNAVEGVAAELNMASGGGRVFLESDIGGSPQVQGWKTDTPDWFRLHNEKVAEAIKARKKEQKAIAKGTVNYSKPRTVVPPSLTREKVNRVVDKLKINAPLGKEEAKVADILMDAAQSWRTENAKQILEFRAERVAERRLQQLPSDEWMRREMGDDWQAAEGFNDVPNFDDSVKIIEESMTPAVDDAITADAMRLAKDMPDFQIHLDDGNVIRMSDVIEQAKEDEGFLQQIRSCAV